jgi:hypothetical protein
MSILSSTKDRVVQVKDDLTVQEALFNLTSEDDGMWCHGYDTIYNKLVDLYIFHPYQMGSVFRDYSEYNFCGRWSELWPTGDMYLILHLGRNEKRFEIVDTKTRTRFSSCIKESHIVGRGLVVEMDVRKCDGRIELKYFCDEYSKVFRLDDKNRSLVQSIFDKAPDFMIKVNKRNHNRFMYDFPIWYSMCTIADEYPKNIHNWVY